MNKTIAYEYHFNSVKVHEQKVNIPYFCVIRCILLISLYPLISAYCFLGLNTHCYRHISHIYKRIIEL